MTFRFLGLWLAASLVCMNSVRGQFDGSSAPPSHLQLGFDSITDERAREWLSILAGPGFQGRGTGQVGYTKAAHWVAGKVAEFGLEPKGDGGTYFQMLPMTRLSVDIKESTIQGPNGLSIKLAEGLGLERFTNTPELKGEVAFVKLRGDSPRIEANVSLQDKIVFYTAEDQFLSRVLQTLGRQRPAASIRIVEGEVKHGSQLQREGRRQGPNSVSGTVSKSVAAKILNALQGESSWIDASQGEGTEVHFAKEPLTFQLRYREEPAAVPNVLAWQPGSDPALRDEYIVMGAHLDHLGEQNGTVFYGADDNGSGSTALLTIANAVALNPVKPKRSILFMWFAAEEIGLVGSAHYVDHPVLPIEKMICMLNIDMVGRNEEKPTEPASENINSIHLVGSKKGDLTLHDTIMEANQYVNFAFEYDEEGVFGRSDQANFFKKGTSVAFLFGGFHPDYHKPTDEVSRINFQKIASAGRLFFVTAHLAAEHGYYKQPEKKPEENKPE